MKGEPKRLTIILETFFRFPNLRLFFVFFRVCFPFFRFLASCFSSTTLLPAPPARVSPSPFPLLRAECRILWNMACPSAAEPQQSHSIRLHRCCANQRTRETCEQGLSKPENMQRFLVTGANKGIGLAVVRGLLDASKMAFVFLGSRDAGRGQDAVQSLITENPDLYSGRVEAIQIDVSDAGSVSRAADVVRTRLGGGTETPSYLDALVNNAGMATQDFSPSAFESCVEVNFRGVVRTTEAFLPLIKPSKGRIVMTSSALGPSFVAKCSTERRAAMVNPEVTHPQITGLVDECLAIAHSGGDDLAGSFVAAGLPGAQMHCGYGLSKALVNMYTLQLARENPSLLINSCMPGFINTDMTRKFEAHFGGTVEELGAKSPLEGAEVLVYLAIGDVVASGGYFESDKQRSRLDR